MAGPNSNQSCLITKALMKKMHKATFTKEAQGHFSEEDALGIQIARFFYPEHLPIIRTFHAALEDASFYIKARQLAELFPEAFSPNPYAGIRI